MPLKFNDNGATGTIGSGGGEIKTQDGLTVSWSGDGSNIAVIKDKEGTQIGYFELPTPGGISTSVEYTVTKPNIEAGQPATEIRRSVGLERI